MSFFTVASNYADHSVLPRKREQREPLMVGMTRAAVTLAGRSRTASWLRGFFSGWLRHSHDDVARLLQAGWPVPMLRDVAIGRRKTAVFANFGPPRAVASCGNIYHVRRRRDYWNADTWYYAVDVDRGFALSVTFENETACDAEFFSTPAFTARN